MPQNYRLGVFITRLLLFIGCFLIGCAGFGGELEPTLVVPSPTVDAWVVETAVSYQALRPIQGQFDGADWSDDVDLWMGKKHTLMIDLGNYFGEGDFACEMVVQTMGQPDQIATPDHDLWPHIQTLPQIETLESTTIAEYLVYYWRSTNDFLIFICDDSMITGSDWFYAGE
ncbi:MAG: hypothetical protein DWQ04_24995 [Chloroflexi bacterium]|nr:MAG: hypothetical protein DWQ04_24995 [Chloroflexota bacterium]